jgi:PhoH-like ATPase
MNDLMACGKLNDGVYLDDSKSSMLSIRFLTDYSGLSAYALDMSKNDDKILAVCLELQKHRRVSLVTKDISLTVKAHVLDIDITVYSEDAPIQDSSELYTGVLELFVDSNIIDALHAKGFVTSQECASVIEGFPINIYENTGVMFVSGSNPNHTALCVYSRDRFIKLKHGGRTVCNVYSRNREQSFALEHLLNKDVRLVTLTGPAGTGKTLLAIACGIQQVFNNKEYDRLVISRPIQPLGKDLGYLPGDMYEKMAPWVGPIKDAVEFVFNGDVYKFDELTAMGAFDIEPLTYIRGRSLPRTLFILDEAQNLTRHEMKTVISRIGKDSKIILTGDVFQIDNHYLDTTNNGLTIVLEKFKDIDIAAHVSLEKGQRSRLATLAAEIL